MATSTELTVITVTKEDPHGLRRTLDSIAAQQNVALQIIVVDASCKPVTAAAVRDAVGNAQSILLCGNDAGPFDGMNRGLREAASPITIFLNGGDAFYAPDTARRISDSFLERRWIWACGAVELEGVDTMRGRVAVGWRTPSYSHWRQVLGLRGLCHQGVVARTDVIAGLGGFCLSVGLSADQRLFAELGRFEAPTILRFPVARYDMDGLSSTLTPADFVRAAQAYRSERGAFLFGSGSIDDLISRIVYARLRIPLRTPRRD